MKQCMLSVAFNARVFKIFFDTEQNWITARGFGSTLKKTNIRGGFKHNTPCFKTGVKLVFYNLQFTILQFKLDIKVVVKCYFNEYMWNYSTIYMF